jgi:branched-subunit amino acid aminotransferase/4-amino-4-deoxychorismate lyase
MPVTEIDGKTVGNGHPGETASRLRDEFHKHAEMTPLG